MSHADTAAAAPPVAPRTVRNRLRSIGRASVVTHGAVARDVALHVAVDAPTHLKRGDLVHLRHAIHLAMARAAALRPQNLDVALVREAHEAREGNRQCDRDTGPDPPTPLRHPERSMANGIGLCCETACGRRNVAPAPNGAQALHTNALFRSCQELMLQPNDGDERVDGVEVGELHPTPAHAAGHPTVADCLSRGTGQAVRHGELALLGLGENERARERGLHGVEVAELAPADLVHPDPFPGGTHEHHLLGDVAEGADAFARPLEPLRGARRQILERGVRLGTLARGGVEIGRPVPGRLMIDGDHDVVYCKRRVTERKRPASSRRAIDTPGTAMRPSRLMLSLITSAPRPNHRTLGSTSEG